MAVSFKSNKVDVQNASEEQILKALTECGLTAERYAKLKCPVDTGNLRNSITNTVKEHTMYVGTNSEYAVYVEMGTGSEAEGGGGTTKPSWVYRDSQGNYHRAFPQKPRHYIKPAIADNVDTYKQIIQMNLKK